MSDIVLTEEQRVAKRIMYDGVNAYQRGANALATAGDFFVEFYRDGHDQHLVNKDGEKIRETQAYIAAACGCSQPRISQLMAAAEVRAILPASEGRPLPERVIRPLTKFVPSRDPKKTGVPVPNWEDKVTDAYEQACTIADNEQSPKLKVTHTRRAVADMTATAKWDAHTADDTGDVPAMLAPLDDTPAPGPVDPVGDLATHMAAVLDSLILLEAQGRDGAAEMRQVITGLYHTVVDWSTV
jgi:hypothetical protein